MPAGAPLDDTQLAQSLAARRHDALVVLFDRYGGTCFALGRRIAVDARLAEDIVQEAFLTVWRDAGRYDGSRGSLSSWLLTVAHHKAVDVVRREQRHRAYQAPLGELAAHGGTCPPGEDEAAGAVRSRRVRAALLSLPDQQRDALLLAYFGGYPQTEIAQLTGAPLGAVKTSMVAAGRTLRGLLDGLAHGDTGGQDTDGHDEQWSPLAVGYAYDVLEPAEEHDFLAHLDGCRRCRGQVAETSATMADLAVSVPAEPLPAGLRERILAEAATTALPRLEGELPPAPVAVALSPRRWWTRPSLLRIAVAAEVVLLTVLAAGVWTVVAQNGQTRSTSVAARCAAVSCPTIPLRANGHAVADVMVLDGAVYVQPTALAPDDASSSEYVLWRVDAGGTSTAVGGFDVETGQAQTVRVGALPVSLRSVKAFAVTKEPGRTPPPAPSTTPLGVGAVSA